MKRLAGQGRKVLTQDLSGHAPEHATTRGREPDAQACLDELGMKHHRGALEHLLATSVDRDLAALAGTSSRS